ncbi:MAG: hypothetical protein IH784_10680, partial [Bacteroidetes bacterium]|nr:hypothetical protein [Bacteroidota bacterium]
ESVSKPDGNVFVVNFGELIERLLLFEKYIIRSVRLQEIPHFIHAFGFQATVQLLNSSAIEIHSDIIPVASIPPQAKQVGRFSFKVITIEFNNAFVMDMDRNRRELNLPKKESLALEETLAKKVVQYPENSYRDIQSQFTNDLRNNVPHIKAALAISLNKKVENDVEPESIEINIPAPPPIKSEPEDMPLNVIFEDDLSGEESGEFPSRWDLLSGSAEVASLGGETVIHLTHNNSIIFPLMDKKDFLPEIFTIEFDVFFEQDGSYRTDIYKIRFFEGTKSSAKIDGKKIVPVDIRWNEVKMGQFGGKTASFKEEKKSWQPKWKHVAVAFNKRSLKLYLDEERILNIPNLGFLPKMFSIGGHFDDRYIKISSIKNIRVNEGGKKLYDRIMEEGKLII